MTPTVPLIDCVRWSSGPRDVLESDGDGNVYYLRYQELVTMQPTRQAL